MHPVETPTPIAAESFLSERIWIIIRVPDFPWCALHFPEGNIAGVTILRALLEASLADALLAPPISGGELNSCLIMLQVARPAIIAPRVVELLAHAGLEKFAVVAAWDAREAIVRTVHPNTNHQLKLEHLHAFMQAAIDSFTTRYKSHQK